MTPEKKIELEIKEHLTKNGWFVFKISQPGFKTRNIRGIADLFAIKDGLNLWIEVKTPKGIQSEAQVKFQRLIKEHGGNYFLARSTEDVENKIKDVIINMHL